ncbi:SMI1/KNR4 family protein [Botrimarina colliarenosi]|uniref:SMI1/KNR4 family protein n=1 Tax=Botrimarina colliarenosi TaxID=2528001 RepID=UPI0018D43CEC|nr:SMI1/KNR4 family protein [Botrimarina colliarenosi]
MEVLFTLFLDKQSCADLSTFFVSNNKYVALVICRVLPMYDALKLELRDAFNALPGGCRFPPASDSEITAFESQFGRMPDAFRWFLTECGGGTIGSEWVDGINELPITHQKYANETRGDDGWSMRGVFIIGWDSAGNPFGIDRATGSILVEDHDFGGVHELAPSFESFLVRGLLENDRNLTNG